MARARSLVRFQKLYLGSLTKLLWDRGFTVTGIYCMKQLRNKIKNHDNKWITIKNQVDLVVVGFMFIRNKKHIKHLVFCSGNIMMEHKTTWIWTIKMTFMIVIKLNGMLLSWNEMNNILNCFLVVEKRKERKKKILFRRLRCFSSSNVFFIW